MSERPLERPAGGACEAAPHGPRTLDGTSSPSGRMSRPERLLICSFTAILIEAAPVRPGSVPEV